MANDSIRFRREFVAGVGIAIAAAIAGCSSSGDSTEEDGNSGDEGGTTSSDTATSTPEITDSPTATEDESGSQDNTTTDGKGSKGSSLVEEDETEIEEEYEKNIDEFISNEGWIELENPDEQIPKENYNFEDYPSLQLLVDEDTYFNAYDPENVAVYLYWVEYDGKMGLGAFQIKEYDESGEGSRGSAGSDKYTDQSADIKGILGEVVEGVDDVPEDLDEEYVELLT